MVQMKKKWIPFVLYFFNLVKEHYLKSFALHCCTFIDVGIRPDGTFFFQVQIISDSLFDPTCIRELDRIYDLNIAGSLLDAIEHKLQALRRETAPP